MAAETEDSGLSRRNKCLEIFLERLVKSGL